MKVALGAGTWRLARAQLLESLMLGIGGALLGMAFGWAGVRGLLAAIPVTLPSWLRVEVDGPILVFSMAVGVVTAVVFGVGPALSGTPNGPEQRFAVGGTGDHPIGGPLVAGRGRDRAVGDAADWRRPVDADVHAASVPRIGIQERRSLTARVVLWAEGARQAAAASLNNTHVRVLEALQALPGVESTSVTNSLPYTRSTADRLQADIFIQGRSADETKTLAALTGADVGPDYFATMGIPLIRGRLFEPTDTTESEPGDRGQRARARMFWPNADPIGQMISWGKPAPRATHGRGWSALSATCAITPPKASRASRSTTR